MKPTPISLLLRIKGWRLWALFALVAICGAELIVSAMDLILKGEITADYLLTGLVASGLVAPPSLAFLSYLLRELASREQALLKYSAERAENGLQLALEAAQLASWELDVINDDLQYEDERLSLLGIAAADAPHSVNAWLERVYPDDRFRFQEQFQAALESDDATFDLEYRFEGQAGHYGWVHTIGRVMHRDPAGRAELAVGITRDVSARKHAEAALLHSQAMLQSILQATDEGILVVGHQGDVVSTNKRLLEMWRLPEGLAAEGRDDRLLAFALDQLVEPDRFLTEVHRLYDSDEESRDVLHFKDGRVFARFTRSLCLDGSRGRIWCFQDITERTRAEESVAESRNLLQTIIDTAPLRIFWKDKDLRYRGCNPLFARDAGKAHRGDVAGADDYQLAWADQAERYRADDREVMESGVAKLAYDHPLTTLDGRQIWLRTSKVPLKGPDGQIIGVLGIYDDVTATKLADEALRNSEARYRALFEHMESGFALHEIVTDASGEPVDYVFLAANEAYGRMTGFDIRSIPGRRVTEVYPEVVRDTTDWIKVFGEIALRGGARSIESHAEGLHRWYQITAYQPGPRQFAALVTDITERKQNEAELEQHRHHLEELVEQRTVQLARTEAKAFHILQSSADGLYGVDLDGRITFINPAASAMLGYSPEQAIGRSAHELFHHSRPDGTPYPATECPSHGALRNGEEMRVDTEVYWHADGRTIPVMYAVHPTFEKTELAGAVISFVDVSVQRAAAEARERALIAAENLARVRSEFLANMSHEIRTPLNGVLGFAQIGARNYQDSEKARNAFEKIITSGNQLLGVINDILDFSKIEAGKLRIEPVEMSLEEEIENVIDVVAERAASKQLELRVELAPDLPARCISDPLRIRQVLLNLLSNAVKFTETGNITLTAARRGDEFVFRVTDTGIGMTETELGQLFNPFQQADGSTTRKYGGTGLGLAISQRILNAMGGRIHVESRLGVGSTFEFRLPCVRPATEPENRSPVVGEPTSSPVYPLEGISILVAEDDPISQVVLGETLADEGARVVLASNGREAVERVIRDGPKAYDVVLMDIQMPEMDGYEATRKILALAPELPVIGQTAHALAEEREKCFAAGMVGHIAKPFVPGTLIKLVLQHTTSRPTQ